MAFCVDDYFFFVIEISVFSLLLITTIEFNIVNIVWQWPCMYMQQLTAPSNFATFYFVVFFCFITDTSLTCGRETGLLGAYTQ